MGINRAAAEYWINDLGNECASCATCGATCENHAHACNPMSHCGDCGAVCCSEHRDETSAQRCPACAAKEGN